MLTFAEGTIEGETVRVVAGEVDGRGLLYVEYYAGQALRVAVPYTQVFIDGEPTTIRALRELEVAPRQSADGFAFTARHGAARLSCTVLLWADATASCTRDPAWVPPGEPACAAAFRGHVERFQCNGLRRSFSSPAIGHDELLRTCSSAFRGESYRLDCLRNGYNRPAMFHDYVAACRAAYRTEHERNFCMFYSFAPALDKDRVSLDAIRTCTGRSADDAATTACVLRVFTGGRPEGPGRASRAGSSKPSLPSDRPTEPLRLAAAPGARVSGARVEVTTGPWNEVALRVTGGMVGIEPVLWVDAFASDGEHRWMNPIDRIEVGRQVRAVREVTALDHVKLDRDALTFQVTLAGKRLRCRADASATFARCR